MQSKQFKNFFLWTICSSSTLQKSFVGSFFWHVECSVTATGIMKIFQKFYALLNILHNFSFSTKNNFRVQTVDEYKHYWSFIKEQKGIIFICYKTWCLVVNRVLISQHPGDDRFQHKHLLGCSSFKHYNFHFFKVVINAWELQTGSG